MDILLSEKSAWAGLPLIAPPEESAKYSGKRLSILKAAYEVISEKGIKEATITEIAKKAGVVDSIIYHYYKNKEDLAFNVLDLQLRHSLTELKFYFEGIMGPVSKLGKMVWYHLYMNDHGNAQMRKNLLLECRSHRNFPDHDCFQTLLKYVGVMDRIMDEGICEGYFRKDLRIPVVRTMIFGLLDEEALACAGASQQGQTLPDFERIMTLILAMIEDRSPKMSKNTKPDKFSAILEAAKHLFAQKGFNSTTMAEVAGAAGVAEGTIYEYFKNKEDLLLTISKQYFKLYKTRLDNAFNLVNPLVELRHLMWHHFSIFAADNDFVTVFLKDIKLNKRFYTTDAHNIFVHYHDKICEILEEGQKSGIFRPEIETRIFRNLVMGSLANLYTRWYFRKPISPIEYTNDIVHFIDLLCRAVCVHPVPEQFLENEPYLI